MNLTYLLKNLSAKNVELWVDGDKLRYRAPENVLTPELLAQIKQYKEEIICLLQKRTDTAKTDLLSYRQKALWFLYELAPNSAAYNLAYAARLVSNVDIPALRQAAIALLERHPVLRTTYTVQHGEPVQTIQENQQVCFSVQEAANWSQDDLRNWLMSESDRPFDLNNGPILRFNLLIKNTLTDASAAKEVILLMTAHYIAVDFWSLELLVSELRVFYEAIKIGKEVTLPPQNLQYKDYVQWENQMLASQQGERLWSYWREQLAGELPILNLPTDRPRSPVQTYEGASHSFVLEEKLTHKLLELAKAESVTLYTIVLAAFQVLLLRYTNQEDILIGSPMAGRSVTEFERIVGYFANPVVLRTDLSGNPTFRELLCRVRSCVLDALEHQDYPFPVLVERLQPLRDPSRSPLYQVAFAWERSHQSDRQVSLMDSDGLIVESIIPESKGAAFDLTLTIFDATRPLKGIWKYNTDLFDVDTIERMAGHFQILLESIVANPEEQISSLPLLTKTELYYLKSRGNVVCPSNPFITFDKQDIEQSIPARFQEQVKKYPHNIAVHTKNYHWTYSELNCRANQVVQKILKQCTFGEERIALLFEHDAPMIAGILGVLQVGKAYVPLDPNYPSDRVVYILEDSRASAVLTNNKNLARAQELTKGIVPLINIDDISLTGSSNEVDLEISPDTIAYILYTSGSTGQPKGVIQNHRNVLHFIKSYTNNLHINEQDGLTLLSSYSFDAALIDIFATILNGATLYPINIKEEGLTHLSQWLQQHYITIYHSTPTLYRHFVNNLSGDEQLSNIRLVVLGGEEVVKTDVDLYKKHFSDECILVNGLGATESSFYLQYLINKQTKITSNTVPVGYPIEETEVFLIDEAGKKTDIYGEIAIRSPYIALGYWHKPNLTQAIFLRDPECGSRRIYRTGDLGRLRPDGSIEFLGRKDFQVKIRGFRIELGEIEAAIAQYPGVQETAVIAREDVPDHKYLVAYIVPVSSNALASSNLRGFLKEKLPDFMIPRAFVILSALPLTPNRKVDRRALRAPEFQPELQRSLVAPRTPIEEMLASIWAEVLRIELVGVHHNFFELGGHSLLATQVISRVRDTFAVELPLRSLFEAPTIAEFAERVENSLKNGQSQEALPLLPIPRSEFILLSFAQAKLWFLDKLQPNSAFYNIPLALRLSGQLNIAALQSSINEIIRRHEALRTNFTIQEGQPVQAIAETLNCQLQVVNLLHIQESSREIEAQRLTSVEANRPFNLEREPLLRSMVLQLGETEYVLLFTMHHIISDGWSLGIFTHELTELYKAFCTGITPVLPSLPVQYADFALWQRQWLQREILEAQLDYWKQQLNDAPALLELPTDRPRSTDQTYQGGHHYAALSLELSRKLSVLSKQTGVTLFMTLLAAFVTLLYRYTSSDDIVVGTPVAGRNRQEIEGLIGFFVNTIVLRTHLGGDPSFEDVLSRVREVTLGAYTHQDLPFEQLVEALQPTRSLSYTPLFQVMFALDEKSVPSFELPELTVSSYAVEIGTAKFDLTLSIENTADGLVGVWEYNVDLFDETTIVRMVQHFQTLLEGIVTNPQQRVSQLPLLTEGERHQILVSWNNTTKEYPIDKCIHQLFEEQVERNPDAIAVEFEDKQLTYRELNQRANCLAYHLKTLGVELEVLVGICVERSLEMVVGLLGILKAGGAYVPLDPTYPTERLAYMLSNSQVKVLLTQEKLADSLPVSAARIIYLDGDWQNRSDHCQENPLTSVKTSNLAYVIYTSGSTGKPKGVLIEHQAIAHHCQNIITHYQLTPGDRILQFASIGFDVSLEQILPTLIVGATLILSETKSLTGSEFHQKLLQLGLTVVNLPPVYWTQWLQFLEKNSSATSLKDLRLVICGGEAMPPESLKLWQKSPLKTVRLLNAYGPTETTITTITFEVPQRISLSKIPIGRPLKNRKVYILSSQRQLVPIGVFGELYIGGAGVARGYLNRSELTAERFIPNSFSNEPDARLYKTGDIARYLPDGNIEFLGRLDNQVKIRGFRIELGEIEAAIAQHSSVRETLIIAREYVPGHKYLVAYIVPNHDDALASSDLRGFLKEKLPNYMIPGVFVMLEALPLTPNGKVDRKALPTPNTPRQELQAESAPRTRSEEILAQIWREVFHREFISIHDNFFEVGGDSILSIQIIFKANSAGLYLTPKQIFQHQTIAELAAVATTTKTLKAFQGLVTGSLPLTPIQRRFFAQNLREPHHFNQAFLLLFPPTLNPDLLQQALQQLLLHHDALRLRFHQLEASWQQFNAPPDETVPFSRIDLSTLQEEALSQTIESTSSQLQASLNLNSGPLLRVALFHLGTQKPDRLLLVIHHLAVDGVSWRILLEDLQTAYKQLESGKPIQLPPKTTSFKHWAEKLTKYAQSPTAKKELTYWSNISSPKITPLPVDYQGGANTKASARSVKVFLNEKETRALLQEIHKAYHTQINDILLTALVQVLATWSGSESVIIDLEGHGREEILPDVDLSRTVGWFTSIFPVLLELKATENLQDAIKSIKEQLRAIPNRGIGYGVLRYLSGDAEITSQLSCLPQAEVSFNYLGQFDWGMQSDSFIKLASESVGSEHSQLGHRSHLLEINGIVVEGQLQLDWTYSENFHSCVTIESLAQDFTQALRVLIAHCLSADAASDTPDVFDVTTHSSAQQINNDQRQKNNVPLPLHLLELSPGISELLPLDTESAYPIAKMQEFMLHHYCNNHQKIGVYHCQQSYDIYDDSLNLNAFKKALLILVQKHPALRTVFITSNGFPAVQVVKKNLRFSINEQDISHLKLEDQLNYIDVVMKQDRQNLFDIENPNEPLFRFGIFQKADNRFEFLMSIHHAITDGWSNIEFLNELYEIYSTLKKGEGITIVHAANVYKEFVALEKEIIGSLDASSFWKLYLKDHTYKPLKPLTTSGEQVEAATEEYKFDLEIIADVRNFCRKLGVSPKALFLSTYLDLISTVMKSNRVCVGVISNGRTERLSDPFGALGLFWNIVPLCQPISSDKGVQIKNVQQSLIDIEPYVRYPLPQILADQQKPELFFATFNFVNFHNTKNLKADTSLKVKARKSHDKFNFPLNYALSMSSVEGNVSLSVEYDKMYFSRQKIRSMIQNYIEILKPTVHTSGL